MHAVSAVRSMESAHRPTVILRCKLVVLGDACVGKTALTQVFHSGGSTYPKNYLMTTGAEFCVKQVVIPHSNTVGNIKRYYVFCQWLMLSILHGFTTVELYIHDCAGQSIFNQVEMNAKYVSAFLKFSFSFSFWILNHLPHDHFHFMIS